MQNFIKSFVFIFLTTLLSTVNFYSQNLIPNGDFESGGNGVGFVTDGVGYTEIFSPFSGATVSGNYAVTTDPLLMNSSIFISGGDHTTGSGKMLIIDGTTAAGSPRFWKAGTGGTGICGLTIGTSYTFSYWMKSVSTTVTNVATQAGIRIAFTGANTIVPAPFSSPAPLPSSGWKQVVYTFRATATCVGIELWNTNVNSVGNDFAVDDFSLIGPKPLSLNYSSKSPTCPGIVNGAISGFGAGGVLPYANYTLTGITPVLAPVSNTTGLFTGLNSGTYSLSVKDAVNTIVTQNGIVLTSPSDLTVSSGVTNCSSVATTLSVSGGASGYSWTAIPTDISLTTPTISNPTVSPNQTTTYTVTSSSTISNNELIYNGDFSLGNVGFTTDYAYREVSPGGTKIYGINTNSNSVWSSYSSCQDHTSPGSGKMYIADGSIVNAGNDKVWCQTVPVTPNQKYDFSFWIQTITGSINLANMEVLINGVSIGFGKPSVSVCVWTKYALTWNSGASTTAEICMYDRSVMPNGNDFAIDDISFKESAVSCVLSKSVTITIPVPINLTINNPSPVCSPSPGFVDITLPAITAGSTTGTVISYWRNAAGTIPLVNPNNVTVGSTYYIKSTIAPCSVIKPVVVDIFTNNTIALSSAVGTDNQTASINLPITDITYSTMGATGATFSGLPNGVNGSWLANTVTISGTPTVFVGSPYNYTVTLTGGCGSITKTGKIIVNQNNTIILSSAAGTDNQTVCVNSAITDITYTTTGATGATFSGLPIGVTGIWFANTVTISGTPTVSVSSPYNYTVTLTGGTGTITTTGTITVTPDNTIALSSVVGTDGQTVCINTPITTITYTTTGSTGATFSGLPTGVTGNWLANTVTISGTPSVSVGSPYTYTVNLTGGCGTITTTGTITVTPNNTIVLSSVVGTNAQTKCINTSITDITYTTTGATGATFSGLPIGVTGSWLANTVTISGTPTVSVGSPFNYTITLTGGCGAITTTGTITVTPDNTITLSSAAGTDAQTICINTPITTITYTTTGATSATFSGLPNGVTGSWSANTVTISGTPTVSVSSPYNYTITLTGGCGTITTTGIITVTPSNTIVLSSAIGTDGQTVCINNPIATITYTTTGATGATFSGLPNGVTGSWSADTVTISGTPSVSVSSPYNYTVTLTGGCPTTVSGSISVDADNTVSIPSSTPTLCINTALTDITHTTTGATGIGIPIDLPNGVTAFFTGNTITISGTPTASGTFNYSIPLTGGCGVVLNAIGTINVDAEPIAGNLTGVQGICVGSSTKFSSDSPGGTWSSDNTSVATVNAATGDIVAGVPGTANITYTVAGNGVCVAATAGRTVTVTAIPNPGIITGKKNICKDATTVYTTNAIDKSGIWESSNTLIATVDRNGEVTGVSPGTTVISYILAAAGGCGSESAKQSITIDPIVTPTFDPFGPICAGATVLPLPTTSNNGITGTWSPNLNTTNSTDKEILTTYTFTPTAGLCAIPTTLDVTILPLPKATATPNGQIICSGNKPNIILTSSLSSTTFDWTVIESEVTGASTATGNTIEQTLTVTGTTSGKADYTVTPSAGGCLGLPINVTVNVNPAPEVITSIAKTTLCSGEVTDIKLTSLVSGTTFSWKLGPPKGVTGAFSSSGDIISQTLKTTGIVQGSVDYIITPISNNCPGLPTTVTITVNPTPEVFGSTGATKICSGDSTNITLSPIIPGTQFEWTVSQTDVTGAVGSTGNTINDPLVAATKVGTAEYTITPTLNECKGNPLVVPIQVDPLPKPILEDGIICVNKTTSTTFKSYTLDTGLSNSNYTFKWSFNGGLINGAVSRSYEAKVQGDYSVIATSKVTGCISEEEKAKVLYNFPATADDVKVIVSDAFSKDPIITVNVTGEGTGPFLYQLDNGFPQSSSVFTVPKSATYLVTVTDAQGCTNITKEVVYIDYPKFFTPNGDGVNDTWRIGELKNSKVDIFDRYGKLIKQIISSGSGWDGTFNGTLLPATDYWFTIDYIEPNTNTTKLFKSHFSLKR